MQHVEGGTIAQGHGAVQYELQFRLAVFRPMIGEIIVAKMESLRKSQCALVRRAAYQTSNTPTSSNRSLPGWKQALAQSLPGFRDGIHLSLGFFHDVFIPAENLQPGSSWDPEDVHPDTGNKEPAWKYDVSPGLACTQVPHVQP